MCPRRGGKEIARLPIGSQRRASGPSAATNRSVSVQRRLVGKTRPALRSALGLARA